MHFDYAVEQGRIGRGKESFQREVWEWIATGLRVVASEGRSEDLLTGGTGSKDTYCGRRDVVWLKAEVTKGDT